MLVSFDFVSQSPRRSRPVWRRWLSMPQVDAEQEWHSSGAVGSTIRIPREQTCPPTDLPPEQPVSSRDRAGVVSTPLRHATNFAGCSLAWPVCTMLYVRCAALYARIAASSEQIAVLRLHRLLHRLESFGTAHPGLRPEGGCISELNTTTHSHSRRCS
jgi:hypothetical protein